MLIDSVQEVISGRALAWTMLLGIGPGLFLSDRLLEYQRTTPFHDALQQAAYHVLPSGVYLPHGNAN